MGRPPLTPRWNEREIEQLKKLLNAGFSTRAIAFRLKRTVSAVDRMLALQDLPTPTELRSHSQNPSNGAKLKA
jgi:hypothetical protein